MVFGGIRGKRSGSVPKVENLKPIAPAAMISSIFSLPWSG